MKLSREHITDLLFILAAVLVTLQIKSCVTKSTKPEEMIRNEERIKYLEKDRLKDSVILVQTRAMYDSLISASKQKVVILSGQYQATKKVYDKIPNIVNDFDREQLRRAITNF